MEDSEKRVALPCGQRTMKQNIQLFWLLAGSFILGSCSGTLRKESKGYGGGWGQLQMAAAHATNPGDSLWTKVDKKWASLRDTGLVQSQILKAEFIKKKGAVKSFIQKSPIVTGLKQHAQHTGDSTVAQ